MVNRTRKPRVVNAPAARAKAPGRSSKYPAVPFTGTERLVSIAPTAADGANFIRSFEWNPGLASTFSAGHYQAQNFDKYTMLAGNTIRYTPACSTLTSGSVYILIDYDPNDSAPATEIEFADNELTKTCSMYSSMSAPIDLGQMDNCKMLVRTGPSATDKLLTDPCAVHIGAFGFGSAAAAEGLVLGHLHIDYRAKLHVRQPVPTAPVLPRNVLSLTFPTADVPDGTTLLAPQLVPLYNTLGATVQGANMFLPPGAYEVHLRLGFSIPSQTSIAYVNVQMRIDGVDVPQSRNDFNATPVENLFASVQTSRILVIGEGQALSLVVTHDHTSDLTLQNDLSLFTARLI
jgi:hypothetical protein